MLSTQLQELVDGARSLHESGSIRPEAAQAFSSFRVSLEQAHAAALEIEAGAGLEPPEPIPNPTAEAFEALRLEVKGVATLIDFQGAKLDAIGQAITAGA
jgi:hypothetical protein